MTEKKLSRNAEVVCWLRAASRAAMSSPAYVLSEEDSEILDEAAMLLDGRRVDLKEAISRARGGGTHSGQTPKTADPLLLLAQWADTAYDANGARLYTDHEIAAAKGAIARLDRVLGEARHILAVHRITERDQGHWGDLWCAVAAASAAPIQAALPPQPSATWEGSK